MMEIDSTTLSLVLSTVRDVITAIKSELVPAYENLAEKLLSTASQMPSTFISRPQNVLDQIEESATELWNLTVAKKAGGELSLTCCLLQAAKPDLPAVKLLHKLEIMLMLQTEMDNGRFALGLRKVRHAACCMVHTCTADTVNALNCKKVLLMSLKTARAWLDAGNPSMSQIPLNIADECLDRWRHVIDTSTVSTVHSEDSGCDTKTSQLLEVERGHFRCLCYRAESVFLRGSGRECLELVHKAQKLLEKLPDEIVFLAMMCYNNGVSSYQKQQFEEAIEWLKESFDLGKIKNSLSSTVQARTLRLLATCYLEWDRMAYGEKALSAVNLANSEENTVGGLLLKLRIVVNGNIADEDVKPALDSILQRDDLTVDVALEALQLVFHSNRQQMALESLRQQYARFRNAHDAWKLPVANLKMLIDVNDMLQARSLVEDLIVEQQRGFVRLDASGLKQIHSILWKQAAVATEAKSFSEALYWYKLSDKFGLPSSVCNISCLAKLRRNMASLYIDLDQPENAEEQLKTAEKLEPSSPMSLFLRFKLALLRNDEQQAVEALNGINSRLDDVSAETIQGFICVAAQLAHEKSKPSIAICALESLLTHSRNPQQILTSLRCLIRLRLAASSDTRYYIALLLYVLLRIPKIADYIQTAYVQLESLTNRLTTNPSVNVELEASWFLKIAWNAALKCDDCPEMLRRLFLLCNELTALCPVDTVHYGRQKTCLLMAAAAGLQLVRTSSTPAVQRQLLQETLNHIQQCRSVMEKLTSLSTFNQDNDTTSPALLLLYEFETKGRLGETDVERILDRTFALTNVEPKVFEMFAALAVELSIKDGKRLCIKALKIAVSKYLQSETKQDYSRCSKAIHSLLELSLRRANVADASISKEAWSCFSEVVEVIETEAKLGYPEIEVLWTMTKGWNYGLHLFSGGRQTDAMRWFELSMKLLKHLSTPIRTNYENQMTVAYADLLSKVKPTTTSCGQL